MAEAKRIPGTVGRTDSGAVAVLTLSRPGRHNAFGPDMAAALERRLADIAADPSIRACVLTGEGKSFCSGADIGREDAHTVASVGDAVADLRPGGQFFQSLIDLPKPIVCAVEGYALGAGLLLALCCDLIVVAESTQFGLPQIALGILPAYGGLGRLAQWVGKGRALDIGLTGRRVGATEASAIGIACSTGPDGTATDRAVDLATRLASLPPLAVRVARESLREMFEKQQLSTTVAADVYRQICLKSTADNEEAHIAWREKRPANYVGR